MDLDASIEELGNKLDEWCSSGLTAFISGDRVARSQALFSGIEVLQELDRLKSKGLATMAALINKQYATTTDVRVASLVRGFEFGAKLAATLHDEMLDTDGETKVVRLMNRIADTLDEIEPDRRTALAELLGNSDARVRASAGAYLVKMMPERALPILREIEQKEHGNSAHFVAHWAVLGWELDGK